MGRKQVQQHFAYLDREVQRGPVSSLNVDSKSASTAKKAGGDSEREEKINFSSAIQLFLPADETKVFEILHQSSIDANSKSIREGTTTRIQFFKNKNS